MKINTRDFTSEILQKTIELSRSEMRDKNVETELLSRVESFFQKLNHDVKNTWYSQDNSQIFIAQSMLAESGELLGEFTKEDRANTNRTREIGLELVDTLYFAVKLADKKKFDIKEGWKDLYFQFARYDLDAKFRLSSAKELSEYVMDCAFKSNNLIGNDFGGNGEITLLLTFASLLAIAEKRKLNIDKIWSDKIAKNLQKSKLPKIRND